MGIAKEPIEVQGEPGGESKEAADRHFAWRFANSAGRNLCAALDPHEKLGSLSDALLTPSLAESLVIVDIPCGAGAAGLSLLDCVRALRLEGKLPILPLRTTIIAGDISDRARDHYRSMLGALDQDLRSVGIFVDLNDMSWDVTDNVSNAKFVDQVVSECGDGTHVLVVTSNFSDAMQDKALMTSFEHFLSQLMGRTHYWPSTLCWVEPRSRKALKYLPKIQKYVTVFWRARAKLNAVLMCDYKMLDPVKDEQFKTGLSVLRCETRNATDVG